MRNRSRLPGFALAAVVAACAPVAPSDAPRATAPAPTSIPSVVASRPLSSAGAAACPSAASAYALTPDVELQFALVRGGITGVVSTVSPSPAPSFPVPAGELGGGMLVGGRDLPMELRIWYSLDPSDRAFEPTLELTTFELDFRSGSGTRSPIHVRSPLTRTPSSFVSTIALPDVDRQVTLEMRVTWRDRCYSYTATGTGAFTLVSAETVGDCAVTQEAIGPQLRGLLAAPLAIGAARARLVPGYIHATYYELPGGDGPYPLAVFDPKASPALARPGGSIDIRWLGDDVRLRTYDGEDVEWYRRRAVVEYMARGGLYGPDNPEPAVVSRSKLNTRSDGSFWTRAPSEPGHYVAAMGLRFDTACYDGGAMAGIGVNVQ